MLEVIRNSLARECAKHSSNPNVDLVVCRGLVGQKAPNRGKSLWRQLATDKISLLRDYQQMIYGWLSIMARECS